ncbi:hypothetical protein ABSA28_01149 [Candidatus Hepatincolaceae symbiont of Richtersius coronifer]
MLKSKSIEDISFKTILDNNKKFIQEKFLKLERVDSDPAMRLLEIFAYK